MEWIETASKSVGNMLSYAEIGIRLALAALLGSAVGLDRQRLNWAAGLRTHMLVCLGASLFMMVSAFGFSDALTQPHLALDPSRIAAQVVSGIGFLGAGTILTRHFTIHGINTAASLWTVAAVGLAVGGGMYVAASVTTLLILVILFGLKPLETRLFTHQQSPSLSLTVHRQKAVLAAIERVVHKTNLPLTHIHIVPGDEPDENVIQLIFDQKLTRQTLLALSERLSKVDGVGKVSLHVEQLWRTS